MTHTKCTFDDERPFSTAAFFRLMVISRSSSHESPVCVKLLGWAAESLEHPAEKSNVEFIDSWCQHNRGNECSLSTRIGVCYVATMLALHRAKIHSLRFLLFFSHFICINIVGRKFLQKILIRTFCKIAYWLSQLRFFFYTSEGKIG